MSSRGVETMAIHILTFLLASAQAAVAGVYQAPQMEVGAALELQKNHHFRYQLDYGAVSEQAEGDWAFDGKTVRLTTRPAPHQPGFELVRDDPAPAGEVVITLERPGFGTEGCRLRAVGTDAATGEKGLVSAGDDGRIDSRGQNHLAGPPRCPRLGYTG